MPETVGMVLVVVPSDWSPEMGIGISEATYQQVSNKLRPGQPILIYKASPVNAIVAEGEICESTIPRWDDWLTATLRQRPRTGLGEYADYVLPVKILYTRPAFNYVPMRQVRQWVDSPHFPNLEWIALSQSAYREFTDWP
jgi:hypothetical protein